MKQEAAAGVQAGKRQSRAYSAKEKAQAVLALWSGRRNPSTLTKELGVPWAAINTWEKRALSGMLTALDPTWKQAAEEQPSLPRRVEKLIERTLKPATAAEPAAAN
jgi:transposase-like protein